jgi:hypothetical protein
MLKNVYKNIKFLFNTNFLNLEFDTIILLKELLYQMENYIFN